MLYPMHKMENSDIFELFIPGLSCGQFYKFEIKNVQGDIIQMVDPYAVMNEEKENGASENIKYWAISLGGFEMAF